MADTASTHIIRGRGRWMKILGKPVPNYQRDGYEWTMDIFPDEEGLKLLKKLGVADRLKDKGEGEYFMFRQREENAKGEKNAPIKVVDAQGRPWDQDTKIGNDSVVDVRFRFKDYGKGKKPGIYPQAVRVLELNEYNSQDFAPLSEDDEFFRKPSDAEDKAFKETFLGLEEDDEVI